MRCALSICREYGQPLAWWWGLPSDEQALYLADIQVRREHEARAARAAQARAVRHGR
jgi:hypothetical protein